MAVSEVVSTERIKQLLEEQLSYVQISSMLQREYPNKRGLSSMNIRRFCKSNNISRNSNSTQNDLDRIVFKAVSEVGISYGRKLMTGYLKSQGVRTNESYVGKSLKRVNPTAQKWRQETAGRSLNPKIYQADYFGHKLHVDQNEKLVMYGVTHICARDGYSGRITAFATMPIKNSRKVYESLFRTSVMQFGMWDQIRADAGKEFVLVKYVQEYYRDFRTNTARTPFSVTKSVNNNVIERIWVEVNSKVNYPIKLVLNHLVARGYLDMTNDVVKYCVSWVVCRVSYIGFRLFVNSWNNHTIPGKGNPIKLSNINNQSYCIQSDKVLSTEDAAQHYFLTTGSRLPEDSIFGIDPLQNNLYLRNLRENEFLIKFPNLDCVFHDVVNNKGENLYGAIACFKYLTEMYSYSVQRC